MGLASTSLPRFLFTGRFLQIVPQLPNFVRLYWRLFRDRRVAFPAKALLVLTLAYLVWPLDAIPDVLPGIGEVDDLAVVATGLWLFVRLCPQPVVRETVSRIAAGKGA